MQSKLSQTLPLALIGAAWGLGARDPGCQSGPLDLQSNAVFEKCSDLSSQWHTIINTPIETLDDPAVLETVINQVSADCNTLSQITTACVAKRQPFLTIGGDHSCAIGTWYGVLAGLSVNAAFGLLWIDAHMDSHTFVTSLSNCIHGMPLACLLGYGDKRLIHINTTRVLDPQHVCLVGVRSFESGEAALLQQLGVRVFYMDEIKQRGLAQVLQEALTIVKNGTVAYGISIDLDGYAPKQVPGVGSPVADGIDVNTCCDLFTQLRGDPNLVGAEIAEYNPSLDHNQQTQQVIAKLAHSLFALRK